MEGNYEQTHCTALHCAVMSVMLAGVAFAESNNQPLKQAAQYAGNSSETIAAAIPQITPAAVTETAKSETPASGGKTQLVTFKELLKDVSPQDRAEFFNGLVMEDGHLVTPDVAPLKRSLSDKQIIAIIQSLKPADKVDINPNRLPVRIVDALKDVPEDVRNEFIENLTFKGDAIVSAYVGGLKMVMGNTDIDAMIKPLRQLTGKTPAHDSSRLCGNGVCYNSACIGDYHNHYYCHTEYYTVDCYAPC